MQRITITLTDELRSYVEQQVSGSGQYGNTSEYFRELIRRDQQRKTMERLEELVMEGLNSGPSVPWTKADFDEIRAKVKEQAKRRRSR